MTTMFKVQTNVERRKVSRAAKNPRRKYPLDTMAVGGMFFVPNRNCKSVSAYISRTTKDLPGKWSTQRAWMWEDKRNGDWRDCEPSAVGAVEGTQVWRDE